MLDMKAIYWLEDHLQSWPSTLFVVSHDRNFLNAVCTAVVKRGEGGGEEEEGKKRKKERIV